MKTDGAGHRKVTRVEPAINGVESKEINKSAEKIIENEILLCKRHMLSNFYLMTKIDLFFEILSLFNDKNKKVPKSA